MANTTDPGFVPVDGARAGSESASDGGPFDTHGARPFGDPDHQLYGASHRMSSPPNGVAPTPDNSYQGRHRAAE